MQIFISYSHSDKDLVERLERDLARAGYSVWRDVHRIATGNIIPYEIDRALGESHVMLVILSDAGIKSRWSSLEYWNFLHLKFGNDISGVTWTRRLIPIRVGKVAVPNILQAFNRIDIDVDLSGYSAAAGQLIATLQADKDQSFLPFDADQAGASFNRLAKSYSEFRLLTNLSPPQLSEVARALKVGPNQARCSSTDPSNVHTGNCVNDLLRVIHQRGAGWHDRLREAVLEAQSPFSPYRDENLDYWIMQPENAWQADDEGILGLGKTPLGRFDQAPSDLHSCAFLTWQGLAFRSGSFSARLQMPLLAQGGAAGLLMGCHNGHCFAAVLRHVDGTPPICLQLLEIAGDQIIEQDATPLVGASKDGSYPLRFFADRYRIGMQVCDSQISMLRPPSLVSGYPGLVRFGDLFVHFEDLELQVVPLDT